MIDQNRRMERLTQISRELSSAADLDSVLQAILSAAAELTNSATASVLEFEEESNTLRFLAIPTSYKNTLQSVLVPLDKSIAGMVSPRKRQRRLIVSASRPFTIKTPI